MRWAPDTPDKWAPDLSVSDAWALDSSAGGLSLGTAIEHFLTAKAAEGASPKTIEWYRMVLGRAGRNLGADRALDSLTPNELRAWLLTLRETLSPISVAGYVRGLKAFGHWCRAEQVAKAAALCGLNRPRVPHKIVEPPSPGGTIPHDSGSHPEAHGPNPLTRRATRHGRPRAGSPARSRLPANRPQPALQTVIVDVLRSAGQPLPAAEIASRATATGWTPPRSGHALEPTQTYARTTHKHYRHLFTRKDRLIGLAEWNV